MNRIKHRTTIALAVAGLSLLAAACGREDNDPAPAAAAAAAPTTAAAPAAPATTAAAAPTTTAAPAAPAAPSAKVGESALGEMLASADGLTLYGFTNDVDAISTCYSTCAEAWPPVIVDEEWAVGPGLDIGIFSTTTREDGKLQLVAGKFPLYTFGGDAAAGDVTGHGSGDVWFAVALDGTLIPGDAPQAGAEAPAQDAAAPTTTAPAPDAPVTLAETDLGEVLVDADGMTLYGFTKDEDGTPTCEGACADAWPPAVVEGDELPAGLNPDVFSVVERPDGTHQLKAGKWPLYRFAGDSEPGDTNGQGSGGVWFVVDGLGGLVKNAG